jgi:tripartite-type tricarboxylate transporter receptor subunit TctC
MQRKIVKLPRRQFLRLAASVVTLPAQICAAAALEYPARPVHIIVGIPPGLAPDVAARLIGPALSERFGQPVIVENRPGAGGVIGAQAVSSAAPDGHTLLLVLSGYAASAALYPSTTFNFVRDIAPVAFIGNTPYLMMVDQSFPARTVSEFVFYAKANPGKINMASPGIGTGPHLAGELFKMMTGVDLVHVPYRDSYMSGLLGGQVQVAFPAVAQAIGYINDGKLRALAVTETKRLDALPEIRRWTNLYPAMMAAAGWPSARRRAHRPTSSKGSIRKSKRWLPILSSRLVSSALE